MAPFYGWSSTASRLVPLRGGSLLFTEYTLLKNRQSKINGWFAFDLLTSL